MNTRKVAAFALVVGLAWPLQAQTTVEAVQDTVVKIKADAQATLDYNAAQNWKRKLPLSVTESAARTIANANYAMVQLGTLRGAPPPLPASAPVITTSPASQTISSGATASMSVSAVGNPAPTYQWYVGTSGTTTSPISGATSTSYTTGALTTTTSYWVRVTNAGGTADSATAVVTVSGGGGGLTPDHTATGCTTAEVATLFNLADAGEVLMIPACSGGSRGQWTAGITKTFPDNVTVIGAGSLTTLGGGDVTVIEDDIATDTPLLALTGINLRVAGITFQGGAGVLKDNGFINVFGDGLRADHVTVNSKTYAVPCCGAPNPQGATKLITFYTPNFLLDHSILDSIANSALYIMNNGGASGRGNEIWAADSNFGTGSNGWGYIEDNLFRGDVTGMPGRALDCFRYGSKVVLRFNTLQYVGGVEQHTTGSGGDNRGCRGAESYGNYFENLPGATQVAYVMHDVGGGTHLVWGNVMATESLKHGIQFRTNRENVSTYAQSPTPAGWGYGGPAPYRTGVVDVSGTAVTWVSGEQFSTAWDDNPVGGSSTPYSYNLMHIVGAVCEAIAGQEPADGPTCRISSVNSATSITLMSASSAGVNDGAYTVGSPWDGNTDSTGYPLLDQPGRGKGDLLSGLFPSKVNTALTPDAIGWANQLLEPVRIWMNTIVPSVTWGGQTYPGGDWYPPAWLVSGRDWFPQASAIQSNNTTPFNGTQSVGGWGTFVNRPTGCSFNETTGVGPTYWATNVGSWNASTSNPQGVQQNGADGILYICTADNTWTAKYGDKVGGEPYTYPHPFQVR